MKQADHLFNATVPGESDVDLFNLDLNESSLLWGWYYLDIHCGGLRGFDPGRSRERRIKNDDIDRGLLSLG